jgi:hypothetical protein
MTKSRKPKRPRRPTGRPELAEQLAEAAELDEGLEPAPIDAELDDEEVQATVRDLDKLVPAEAYLPDNLDEEKSLQFEVPRAVKR